MRIKFFDKIAGISEGTVKDLPSVIALEMIEKGYAIEEGNSDIAKPEKEKSTVKQKTKKK